MHSACCFSVLLVLPLRRGAELIGPRFAAVVPRTQWNFFGGLDSFIAMNLGEGYRILPHVQTSGLGVLDCLVALTLPLLAGVVLQEMV